MMLKWLPSLTKYLCFTDTILLVSLRSLVYTRKWSITAVWHTHTCEFRNRIMTTISRAVGYLWWACMPWFYYSVENRKLQLQRQSQFFQDKHIWCEHRDYNHLESDHRMTFNAIVLFLVSRLSMACSAPCDSSYQMKLAPGIDCSNGCLHDTSSDKQRPSRSPPLYSTASRPCGRCSGACDPKMA